MTDTKYKLRYLPLFYEDLEEKIVYIADKLHNVKAANDLIDEVERAILERQLVAGYKRLDIGNKTEISIL